jgi:hypothetical protein
VVPGEIDPNVEVLVGRPVAATGHQSRDRCAVALSVLIETEGHIEIERRVTSSDPAGSAMLKRLSVVRKPNRDIVLSSQRASDLDNDPLTPT